MVQKSRRGKCFSVWIPLELLSDFRGYCNLIGIKISKALEESLRDWLFKKRGY